MEIVKGGTLCFWGDWFGRPYDNYHIVVSAEWYLYGKECVPQNLCKRTYTYEDSENVLLEYSGTLGNGSKTFNPQGKYALEIV